MNLVRDIMTIEEVCDYLQIGRSTFDQLVKDRELPVIRVSEKILRVKFEALQAWLDAQTTKELNLSEESEEKEQTNGN